MEANNILLTEMTDSITRETHNLSTNSTSQEISKDYVLRGSDDSERINENSSHIVFQKNNSFPQFLMNNDPLRKNPITLETSLSILSKRLLPPVKITDAKRIRSISESPICSTDDIESPTSELVTGKDPSPLSSDADSSDLRICIDEQCQSTTSGNSTQELSESTESDNSLHGQFFQSLRLGKLYRANCTNSTSSLPVPCNASGWSPRDDDTQSCASDSVTVKVSSSSKCSPHGLSNQAEHQEIQLVKIKETISTKEESSYESDDDGLQFYSIPSNLNEKGLDWLDSESPKEMHMEERTSPDEEEVLKLPSTQSSGILPAIPSHKTRERSYLVGCLTKHESLLGVEELNRYFPDRLLKIFVGTWNMQKKAVPKNLDDFMLPKHKEFLQDIYVIGVQESTQDQKMWEIKLQETLGVNHVLIRSASHGVLHLSIFVRRDLIWFCSSVEDDKVTTRMVSQVKTKGAVAIGFRFFGTSLLFVNSHFHSGQSKVKERVEDYNKIKEKLRLPRTDKVDAYRCPDVTSRYDCIFWFGDLNFRVNIPPSITMEGGMNRKEALKSDQLHAVMKRNLAFHGFTEPRIKFQPTYKFLTDSESYAVSSKPRTPSYTDRILYKNKENDSIRCSDYDSVSSLKNSDHRPVYGFFKVSLKPGRDNISVGACNFRSDVYEKAARLRAHGGDYQNSSSVCNIL